MKRLEIGAPDARFGALLVHGNDLCAEFYQPLAEALAAHDVRTVLVTLPGFSGQPPSTPGPPRWDDFAVELAALLDASFPRGAALIGHSLGGLFAFLAAARAPRALRSLVLCEPPIFPTRALAAAAARTYTRDVVFAARDEFHNWSGSTWRIHRPADFPAAALAHYLDSRRRSDPAWVGALFEALPALYPLPYAAVTVPTLIVRGAHSGWRMRANLAILRRRFPNPTAVTIPGCAHFMANEADAALAAAIAGFIRTAG